uniref:THAP domain-containing protein 7 n=1 Tax=Semicossyphus pulcher TaxID=241346 RepID=UPI0037E7940D
MPRHCSAGGCKSRDNRESRDAGITFHKLPKGATRRNLWITNSRRADSWDPQSDFVYFCSQHFTPESFELTGYSGIRRLREDAFPTLFDSSSTSKSKRAGRLQKRRDASVRKNLRSGSQEDTEQETDKSLTSEEPTGQRSEAALEETRENTPASSQEPSDLEQLSQEEHSPSPQPEPRPVSPSRYMRRLPPPPGFYLSKEHSYAQLCPLLWRRRYDQAIDCLEKALRQLHAARRRENRLRSTVLRLQDKRLKQALLVHRDVCKDRRSWTPGGDRRRGRGGCDLEEAKCEDAGVFEDRCEDQVEFGGRFLPDTNSWSEEERGHCFYCGRGQGQAAGGGLDSGEGEQLMSHEDSLKIHRNNDNSPGSTAERAKDRQTARLQRRPGTGLESSHSDLTDSTVLLQPGSHAAAPRPHQQGSGSQQKLLLSEGQTEAVAQQLFWIQDCAEGQVVLVPVPAEDGLQSMLKREGVTDGAQTILVSEVDLKGDLGQVTEDSGRLSCDEHREQLSVINSTSVEMREDVREKLKEHLEGFHLQLSTEFLT